jgi:hydrogenase 3 maturation protease
LPADFSSLLKNATRVVVVGVGSDIRGDDAAGMAVLKDLKASLKSRNVLLVEGGVAPENFASQIRRFGPSHIVFVDATDFGAKPGDVTIAEPGAITGQSVSTHTVSLSALMDYLGKQTGSRVALVGIQPKGVNLGSKMCDSVKISVGGVVEILLEELKSV